MREAGGSGNWTEEKEEKGLVYQPGGDSAALGHAAGDAKGKNPWGEGAKNEP